MSCAMPRNLTHLDRRGRVRMVDVGDKRVTARTATARGRLFMHRRTLALLESGEAAKGNAIAAAHLAGVMAAKRTSDLIPLAHPLSLDGVDLAFVPDLETSSIRIEARVRCRGRTRDEMEALTAVAAGGPHPHDIPKAARPGVGIRESALWGKRGGAGGN